MEEQNTVRSQINLHMPGLPELVKQDVELFLINNLNDDQRLLVFSKLKKIYDACQTPIK